MHIQNTPGMHSVQKLFSQNWLEIALPCHVGKQCKATLTQYLTTPSNTFQWCEICTYMIDCSLYHTRHTIYIILYVVVFTLIACHYHHSNAIRVGCGALMEADIRRDSISFATVICGALLHSTYNYTLVVPLDGQLYTRLPHRSRTPHKCMYVLGKIKSVCLDACRRNFVRLVKKGAFYRMKITWDARTFDDGWQLW